MSPVITVTRDDISADNDDIVCSPHHCLINVADNITLCVQKEGTSPCYTDMGRCLASWGQPGATFCSAAFLSKVGEDIEDVVRI